MLNLLGMMTSPDVPDLFFINGGRGSGKSTFLQSLRKSLCEPTHYECTIDVLAEVDPTELADTEDFFIHILGRVHSILKNITRQHDSCEYGMRETCREAYSIIQRMAKGLGLLVRKPESVHETLDAGFFVQESVEACDVPGKRCTVKQIFLSVYNLAAIGLEMSTIAER